MNLEKKSLSRSAHWIVSMGLTMVVISTASTALAADEELGKGVGETTEGSQGSPTDPEETDRKKSEDSETAAQQTGRDAKILERITVVGSSKKISEVPGSAALIEGPELEQAKTGLGDITRALRTVPGLNIVEEEGYGLRPNIGMRGTPSERSNSITLMEDGVLIAPAPYAAPSAYYFPSFARMAGVEVLKGAGQIKYGPRTTGGSLNLLSTAIPDQFTLKGNIATGSHDTTRGHVYLGESFENFGYLLETFQIVTDGFKDLDGGGDTGFDLQDYIGKFRFNTDRDSEVYQQLQFKFGYYEQDSNETYLGLSREDFGNTPNRRYAASQRDKLNIDQRQYQAQHYIEASDNIDITTTAYYNDTARRWNKLDSVSGLSLPSVLDNPSAYPDAFSYLTGAGNSPANALTLRDADRDYYGAGVQSVLVATVKGDSLDHRFEFGARYHQDEEDRQQQDAGYRIENGSMVQTSQGASKSQTNRVSSADATALYLQDTISAGSWKFLPGLRYEKIQLHRKDYGKNDPDRTGAALAENDSSLDVWIPGIGTEYRFNDTFSTFAGVHKGFSPPGPSDSDDIKEEESIAYEIGTNITKNSLVSQFTFFINDYDNLLGVDSLASGGAGTGDQFNLGEALTHGVEASMKYDVGEFLETSYRLPVYATYTYTSAEFRSTFKSDAYGEVQSGDKIPYIPEHQFAIGAGIEHDNYGQLLFRSYFVDSMNSQPSSTSATAAPQTDSYYVVDMHVESPDIKKGVRLFLDATNLFDNEYIVSWRPSGARPGMPFTALAGIKFDL
jgi:Fe(3+) dicitrate transport protein